MVAPKSLRTKAKRCAGPKSKTGCLTCRIRRVKCDETQPHCRRCTSTGRNCEGPVSHDYRFIQEIIPQEAKSCSLTFKSQLGPPSLFLDRQSQRSIEYFVKRTAPILSGALDVRFWEYFIPQLAHSEPIVQNAVLAINDLFEHPVSLAETSVDSLQCKSVTDLSRRRALGLYNSAISRFNGGVQQSSQDNSMALISCILFICIELQMDGFQNALALLEKGLALHSSTAALNVKSHKTMSTLDEVITRMLWRLAIQVSVFGAEMPPNWGVHAIARNALETRLSLFDTLEEAGFLQYILRDDSHTFLRDAVNNEREDAQRIGELVAQQHALLVRLNEWNARFQCIICTKREEIRASAILSMTYESLVMFVSSHPLRHESVFDEYNGQFERILNHAEIAIEMDDSGASFRFDGTLLINLHLVAVKCRHPTIRRRALSLLQKCPPRDCWWKALPHARVAERAIQVEERSCGRLVEFAGPYGNEANGHTLAQESQRIYNLEFLNESQAGMAPQRSWKPGRYLAMSRRMS